MKILFLLFAVFSATCLATAIPPYDEPCQSYKVVDYLDVDTINNYIWYMQLYSTTGDCNAIPMYNSCVRVSIQFSLNKPVWLNFQYEIATSRYPNDNLEWYATIQPKNPSFPNGNCILTYEYQGDMIYISDAEILYVDQYLLIIAIHGPCKLPYSCQTVWILTSNVNYKKFTQYSSILANIQQTVMLLGKSLDTDFVKVDQSNCNY